MRTAKSHGVRGGLTGGVTTSRLLKLCFEICLTMYNRHHHTTLVSRFQSLHMDLLSVTRLCLFVESIEGTTSSTYVDQGFLDALIGLIIVWMAKKHQHSLTIMYTLIGGVRAVYLPV